MTITIKNLRKTKALTLDHLADITGLSKGFLSQIENGVRQPSKRTLEIIAEALDTTPSRIMAEDELSSEVMATFEKLSDEQKAEALRFLRFLSSGEDKPEK